MSTIPSSHATKTATAMMIQRSVSMPRSSASRARPAMARAGVRPECTHPHARGCLLRLHPRTCAPMTSTGTHIERYRTLRAELERSILPLAGSVDGRRFTLQASLHGLEFELGGYVRARSRRRGRGSGQVLALEASSMEAGRSSSPARRRRRARALLLRRAAGEGVVLDGDAGPFHDAPARGRPAGEVRAWAARTASRTRAARRRRRSRSRRGVAAALDAGGLRPPHVPLRAVGLGQDLLASALMLEQLLLRDRAAHRHPRPELGLRPPRRAPRRCRPGDRRAAARRRPDRRPVGPRATATAGSGCGSRDLDAGHPGARCCGSIRSPTARSTPSCAELIADRAPGRPRGAPVDGAARGAGARAAHREPRHRPLGIWARGRGRHRAGRAGRGGGRAASSSTSARSRPAQEQSLVATAVLDRLWRRRSGRAPVLHRDRRGAQRVPRRARGPAHARSRRRRRCGSPPRAASSACYLLVSTQRPAEGPRERAVAVRQPRPDADELAGGRRVSCSDVFSFVPPGLVARSTGVRPRRGARGGQDRLAPGAAPLRPPRRAARAAATSAGLGRAARLSPLRRPGRRRRAPRGGGPRRPGSATSGSHRRRRARRARGPCRAPRSGRARSAPRRPAAGGRRAPS